MNWETKQSRWREERDIYNFGQALLIGALVALFIIGLTFTSPL